MGANEMACISMQHAGKNIALMLQVCILLHAKFQG